MTTVHQLAIIRDCPRLTAWQLLRSICTSDGSAKPTAISFACWCCSHAQLINWLDLLGITVVPVHCVLLESAS